MLPTFSQLDVGTDKLIGLVKISNISREQPPLKIF